MKPEKEDSDSGYRYMSEGGGGPVKEPPFASLFYSGEERDCVGRNRGIEVSQHISGRYGSRGNSSNR